MSRYVFHKLDPAGEIVDTFHAELAPAQLQRLLHPYITALRAGVRLLHEIEFMPVDEVPPSIRERAAAFRAIAEEYQTGTHDDD